MCIVEHVYKAMCTIYDRLNLMKECASMYTMSKCEDGIMSHNSDQWPTGKKMRHQ